MEEWESAAEALLNGDIEAKVIAARGVGDFTCKQRGKLIENGVITPLIFMLRLEDYEAIEAAIVALLSLACGSERNKVCIAKSGAIPLLMNVLHWRSEPLFELAIAALLILSSSKANKVDMASSGVIQLLVDILGSENSGETVSTQAKLDIVSTFHNLATCPQVIPSIVCSGVVVAMLQLIYEFDKSSELVEKAMALLEVLVASSEAAMKEATGIEGAIQVLVEAVEEGSPQSREHAVGVLLVICQSCRDQFRGMILKEGAMPGLLQLSIDGTWRAKEKANELLLLLRDGSTRGPRGRQSKNLILERVMRRIDKGESGGRGLRLVEKMIAKLRT